MGGWGECAAANGEGHAWQDDSGGDSASSSADDGESTPWLLADSSLLLYSVPAVLAPRADELFDGPSVGGGGSDDAPRQSAPPRLGPSAAGLDSATATHRLRVYGPNALYAPVRPVWRLFAAELLNPVFLFQVASVVLWLFEHYVLYAATILATSLFGAALEATELHAAAARLARLAAGDGDGASVMALRNGTATRVPVRALVPGDVVRLAGDAPAPADCTLLAGSALCNEASLTGESSPVHKHPWVPGRHAARLSPAAAVAAAAPPLTDGQAGEYAVGILDAAEGRVWGGGSGGGSAGRALPVGSAVGTTRPAGGSGARTNGAATGAGLPVAGMSSSYVVDPPGASSYHDVPQELLVSSSPFAPSFVEDVLGGREDQGGGRPERDGEDWRSRCFHQQFKYEDEGEGARTSADGPAASRGTLNGDACPPAVRGSGFAAGGARGDASGADGSSVASGGTHGDESDSDTVASSSDGAWSELDVLAPRQPPAHLTRGYGSTTDLSRLASANEASPEADDSWAHGAHTIYAGTRVLQARRGALAVVTRTAASTMRGELVRDILVEQARDEGAVGAPENDVGDCGGTKGSGGSSTGPGTGNLLGEAYVVLAALLAVGIAGSAAAAVRFMSTFRLSAREAALEALDLITIAVPPSLPATISFGLAFALARLNRHGILCVRASVVTRAALVDVLCFDKTGTLTEEGLDVRALRLADDGRAGRAGAAAGARRPPQPRKPAKQPVLSPPIDVTDGCLHNATLPEDVERVMAACHTLAYVQGAVVGDEVDLKLFELTGWRLVDDGDDEGNASAGADGTPSSGQAAGGFPAPPSPPLSPSGVPMFMRVCRGNASVAVTRLLDFSSPLARMGVVAEWTLPDGSIASGVLIKGAPEVVASLCRRDTVPSDFAPVLAAYAAAGFRVLALASRDLSSPPGGVSGGGGGRSSSRGNRPSKVRQPVVPLDPLSAPREVLERDLRFLALVVLENRLKEDTSAVIAQLTSAAKLPCRMVTGDHARTAMAVALQCGILQAGSRVVLGDVALSGGPGPARTTTSAAASMAGSGGSGRAAAADTAPRVRFTLALNPRVRLTRAQVWAGILHGGGDELVLTGGAFRLLAAEYAALTAAAARPTLAAAPLPAASGGGLGWLADLPAPSASAVAVLPDEDAVVRLQRAFYGVALQRCSVWARMTAADKTALVRALASVSSPPLRVAMCGDGANDAGALREAFVGLSLRGTSADEPDDGADGGGSDDGGSGGGGSGNDHALSLPASSGGRGHDARHGDARDDDVDVEACRLLDADADDDRAAGSTSGHSQGSTSPATTGTRDHAEDFEAAASLAAPLTSRRATIRAMVDAVVQGRAAAAASLAAFCFMFLYSTIQFSSVAALYVEGAVIGDTQFLFVDLVIVLPLATLMGRTDAARGLGVAKPPGTLWHPRVVASGLGQAALQVAFQALALAAVRRAGLWVGPAAVLAQMGTGAHTLIVRTPAVSALWAFVNLQYVWTAVALNRGPPFRQPLPTNRPFAAAAAALTAVCLGILVAPPRAVRSALELVPLPAGLRGGLGALAVVNGAASIALDVVVGRRWGA